MTSTASGTPAIAAPVTSPRLTWWRRRTVRALVGVAVTAGLLLLPLLFPLGTAWRLPPRGSMFLEVTPYNLSTLTGFVLLPVLRQVSYRKRDMLVIVFVPIWGAFIAGLVVSRLLALPRRDWPPRLDELPLVVRIPGGRGAYVTRSTFGAAEELRTTWCVNPDHQHPYESWAQARTLGCRKAQTG